MENAQNQAKATRREAAAIWAIDPVESVRPSAEIFKHLNHYLGPQNLIEGVYVYGTQAPVAAPEAKLATFVAPFEQDGVAESHVIYTSSNRREGWVEALLDYAYEQWASLIVLTAQNRNVLNRLVFGGFANRLLQRSPFPLVFIPQKPVESALSKRVLFATDFSEESMKAFKAFIQFVGDRADEIVLYHVTGLPIPLSATTGLADSPIFFSDAFRSGVEQWVNGKTAEWIQSVQPLGPQLKIRALSEESTKSPAFAILEAAEKEKIDVIGVATKAGPMAQFFWGSVGRELIMSSSRLVWVCGPTFFETNL